MPQHLLLISLGPIQDFIRSARRCQDLWYGSWLLSQLAKSAALSLKASCGAEAMVFPGSVLGAGQDADPSVQSSVANKLVVLTPAGKSPAELAENAKQAMANRLDELAKSAFDRIQPSPQPPQGRRGQYLNRALAEAHVKELMEFLWVAVPLAEGAGAYDEARRNAERLMAARKNTRIWGPVRHDVDGANGGRVPKSALDGVRESVISERAYKKLSPEELRREYYVKGKERLCGIGLLKRLGIEEPADSADAEAPTTPHHPHFHSTSHVAAGAWRTRLAAAGEAGQDALKEYLASAAPHINLRAFRVNDERSGIAKNPLINAPTDKAAIESVATPARMLPQGGADAPPAAIGYDGYLLYEDRIPDTITHHPSKQHGELDPQAEPLLRSAVRKLHKMGGAQGVEPGTYYALLLADGDFMGAAIDAITTHEGHRNLSSSLDEFATQCDAIVAKHCGSLIYSGGDDVLALLPLHTVLACARELHDDFSAQLNLALADIKLEHPPTLSVGIAISHHLTDMAEALELARKAERQAKAYTKPAKSGGPPVPKNALAILVEKRSGPERALVNSWSHQPDELINEWAKIFSEDDVPRGLIHEISTIVAPLMVGGNQPSSELISSLIQRTLLRKRSNSQKLSLAPGIKTLIEKQINKDAPAASLQELSETLQIAVLFLDAYQTAFGPTGSSKEFPPNPNENEAISARAN